MFLNSSQFNCYRSGKAHEGRAGYSLSAYCEAGRPFSEVSVLGCAAVAKRVIDIDTAWFPCRDGILVFLDLTVVNSPIELTLLNAYIRGDKERVLM